MTSKTEFYCGDIPFIRSGEIHLKATEIKISKDALKSSSAKMVEIGDLLLALYGATSGDISMSKIHGAINQAILCIRPQVGFGKSFILYFWQNNYSYIVNQYLQGGQGNLSAEIVRSIKFRHPSLAEQERIASVLSLIDERIEACSETIKELVNEKKALLSRLFDQSLRFPPFSDPWQPTTLGEVVECKASSMTESQIEQKGNTPVFGANGLCGYTQINEVIEESILIIKDGSGVGRVRYMRYPHYFLGTLNALCNKSCHNSLRFVYHFLEQFDFRMFISGSGIPHIYFKDYSKASISLPSLAEQRKIAEFLSLLDERISVEEELKSKYEEQKKYLLQSMFV